ncbi:hypothetical protein LTR91_025449 [Friedmanniomyces endolithicus]|uniref:Uncharacterized protein n=1 Tax=Friedmanniomyces endolithicus TaxID=329885 RepID=A0AAN6K307_9PEZI|nr:hypothetical protein LTS02_010311 [Friedmanniomyces endolithicus]KAK0880608.1 hypothetical protein LTR87_005572 [Friedmanniomyces endolithicus]KAK0912766.1 hypothetical protein LTR57_014714 [Friedmanniomyces endolithicus]KAK0950731.1 hypothetical protein LTR91_025449 [Friedmanniomyces endolithicus]KAK1028759.1 hypothetical protein LTS16_020348 [Friedmanniomyces endolithicus]
MPHLTFSPKKRGASENRRGSAVAFLLSAHYSCTTGTRSHPADAIRLQPSPDAPRPSTTCIKWAVEEPIVREAPIVRPASSTCILPPSAKLDGKRARLRDMMVPTHPAAWGNTADVDWRSPGLGHGWANLTTFAASSSDVCICDEWTHVRVYEETKHDLEVLSSGDGGRDSSLDSREMGLSADDDEPRCATHMRYSSQAQHRSVRTRRHKTAPAVGETADTRSSNMMPQDLPSPTRATHEQQGPAIATHAQKNRSIGNHHRARAEIRVRFER